MPSRSRVSRAPGLTRLRARFDARAAASKRKGTIAALALTTCAVLGASTAAPALADDAQLPVSYNFLGNMIKYAKQVDLPGANNWSCKPNAEHPHPVVLVHGSRGRAATNWGTYAPLLANEGACVYALTYGVPAGQAGDPLANGGMNDMRDSAKEVGAFVDKVLAATGAAKVDLIGHSQGGVVSAWYLKKQDGAAKVRTLVTLGSVLHGRGPGGLAPPETADCVSCGQLKKGSDFINELDAGGIAVSGVNYLSIVTRYDEVAVPFESGLMDPAAAGGSVENVVMQDKCWCDFTEHLELAADPNAARLVLNKLNPQAAQPLKCRFTLPFTGPLW